MKAQRHALEVVALYLLAAAGCESDSPTDTVTAGAGVRPDGGGWQPIGTECAADAGTAECGGGYFDWDGCKRRRIAQQCYVAETTNGETLCMAPDDPGLIAVLSDIIQSNGFIPEFNFSEPMIVPLPASCESLIACCDQQSGNTRTRCFDRIDRDYREYSVCRQPNSQAEEERRYGCLGADSDAGTREDSDADAGSSTTSGHSLCCYNACGHTKDT